MQYRLKANELEGAILPVLLTALIWDTCCRWTELPRSVVRGGVYPDSLLLTLFYLRLSLIVYARHVIIYMRIHIQAGEFKEDLHDEEAILQTAQQ